MPHKPPDDRSLEKSHDLQEVGQTFLSADCSGRQECLPHLQDLVAELTVAAYPVALQHKDKMEWLELELDLWKVLGQTVKKWEQHVSVSFSK